MTRYGPPGGPYGARREPPGEPDQPPYGPPTDPWGNRQESWGDLTVPQPVYRDPPPAGAPYPPGPPYPAPPPAGPPWASPPQAGGWGGPPEGPDQELSAGRPRRRGRLVLALVAVLVVLLAAAVGSVLFLVSGEDGAPSGGPTTGPGGPTGPAAATGPALSPEATPNDNIGMNAAMALVDDCVVNDGTEQDVQLRIVRCDDEPEDGVVFRVLAVFNEKVTGDEQERLAQAQQICEDTEGYTHHYYEVGESVAPSFVLCMAQQD